MLSFTLAEIQQMTDVASFDRGRRYYRQGRVHLVSSDVDDDPVRGQVSGSARRPYTVELSKDRGGLYGWCSCPVGDNCKHAVALALAWLERWEPVMKKSDRPSRLTPWEQWLAELPAPPAARETGPEVSRFHLLYHLDFSAAGQLLLRLRKGYLKKSGEWSRISSYTPEFYSLSWGAPEFLEPLDIALLRTLHGAEYSYGGYELEGTRGGALLSQLPLTGRLHLGDEGTRLATGPRQALNWSWIHEEGERRLESRLASGTPCRVLNVEPLIYLDAENRLIGELETELPAVQAAHLAKLPAIPDTEFDRAGIYLRRYFAMEQLPLPQEPQLTEASTPVPQLMLVAGTNEQGVRFPGALLNFRYGECTLAPDYHGRILPPQGELIEQAGQQWLIRRDEAAEQDAMERLADNDLICFQQFWQWHYCWSPHTDSTHEALRIWKRFTTEQLPQLQQEGWQVEVDPDYAFTIERSAFSALLSDAEGHWFDFALQLPLGDRLLAIGPVIEIWFEEGMPDTLALPLEDGWVEIDTTALKPMHSLILSLYQQAALDQPVRLPPFQAVQLVDQAELDDRAAPLTRLLVEQLKDFNGLTEVPPPSGLAAQLRDYQQQGLNWLHFLQVYGFGGILADDMGLGKTLQTLALVQSLKDRGELNQPALVIAPTSLMGNWQREAEQFAPTLQVCVLHGPKRAARFEQLTRSDLVITSYPLLLRDAERYADQTFSLLVLDEAQAIKNPKTRIARAVRELEAHNRLCLTGTPLENHLGELWALMDFALPGLLGGLLEFNQVYRVPIEQHGDQDCQQALARRIAPFMLRRTKHDVLADLPPKSEMVQYVELGGRQRELYEAIRVSMEQRIRTLIADKGAARSRIEFLDALLKLRQACIDPQLVKLEQARTIKQSAKLEWLADNLPEMIEEGRQILLFSQFTQVLGLVEALLKRLGIVYAKLTGQTRKRQQAVDLFQSGQVPIFLISLKAGGSGLNLTAADTVIHLDPWWNPAVEQQATDRAYRIGQDKPVFVYKLVAADTVEERIQQLQTQKQALADALFDATGKAVLPTDADQLLGLLGPV